MRGGRLPVPPIDAPWPDTGAVATGSALCAPLALGTGFAGAALVGAALEPPLADGADFAGGVPTGVLV